ncbi:MAG: carboxylating nicotinate-nucleotide diphosphorylase [Verrucomicrobiota bacterium]|jgi:nicotinate-nucleotide pyrophosphorylase (carboxylating)|nr:carboxylating nicotinate-nucleotide diphosphorylase [Verrucomicrobiota bacterium]
MPQTTQLPLEQEPDVQALLRRALQEDIGSGDATTLALVDADVPARASLTPRHPMVVAGLGVAAEVFRLVDERVEARACAADGEAVGAGRPVMQLRGAARALLTAERTALNVLQRMTGIATATAAAVKAVSGTGTQILDTRKTAPGLRRLDKYAVHCGGGTNHRIGLYDAILIKDNHLAFWRENHRSSLADAVRAARKAHPDLKIEIEVDTLAQLEEVLPGKPDWVLLDNMSPETIVQAVALCRGICKTEASGGLTPEAVAAYARTGVTAVSLGALTHSVKAADIGLDFE